VAVQVEGFGFGSILTMPISGFFADRWNWKCVRRGDDCSALGTTFTAPGYDLGAQELISGMEHRGGADAGQWQPPRRGSP
jgi:hypothetical protein